MFSLFTCVRSFYLFLKIGVWQQELKYALFKNKIIKIIKPQPTNPHQQQQKSKPTCKWSQIWAYAVHVHFYLSSFCPASSIYILVFGICEERMKNAIPFIKTFFFGIGSHITISSNSLSSQGWPCTFDSQAFISLVLGLHMCTAHCILYSAGNWTQGFVLYQLSHIPSPFVNMSL